MKVYHELLEKNKILIEDIQECLFDFFNNNDEVFTHDRVDTTAKYPEGYGNGIICINNASKIKNILLKKHNIKNVNLLHIGFSNLTIKAQISIEFINNNVMSNITFNLLEIPKKNIDMVNKYFFKPAFRFTEFNAGVSVLVDENYIIYEVINELEKKTTYSGDFKIDFFESIKFIDKKEKSDISPDEWLSNYFNISSNRIDFKIKGNKKISEGIRLFFKIKEIKIEKGRNFTELNKSTKDFLYNLLIKKEDLRNQFTTEDIEVYQLEHDEKLNIKNFSSKINYDVFKSIS